MPQDYPDLVTDVRGDYIDGELVMSLAPPSATRRSLILVGDAFPKPSVWFTGHGDPRPTSSSPFQKYAAVGRAVVSLDPAELVA